MDLIEKKKANVLVEKAELDPTVRWLMNYETLGLNEFISRMYRRMNGGDWIGGCISLYRDRFIFEPGFLNREVLENAPTMEIPLATITSVTPRFGLVTGIVEVKYRDKILRIRCFSSKLFARALQAAVEQRQATVNSVNSGDTIPN